MFYSERNGELDLPVVEGYYWTKDIETNVTTLYYISYSFDTKSTYGFYGVVGDFTHAVVLDNLVLSYFGPIPQPGREFRFSYDLTLKEAVEFLTTVLGKSETVTKRAWQTVVENLSKISPKKELMTEVDVQRQKSIDEFYAFCKANPTQRFWQAVYSFTKCHSIRIYDEAGKVGSDPYHFEDVIGPYSKAPKVFVDFSIKGSYGVHEIGSEKKST